MIRKKNEPPERIYLQTDPEGEKPQDDWISGPEDVTWCENRINDTDIEYVRTDLCKEEP